MLPNRKRFVCLGSCLLLSTLISTNATAFDISDYKYSGFGTIGFSRGTYNDAGFGFKLGTNIGHNLFGVENLGGTIFFERNSSSENVTGRCERSEDNNLFAAGATYSYKPVNTPWILQGRVYPYINNYDFEIDCGSSSFNNDSSLELGVGAGGSAKYQFSRKMNLLADIDFGGTGRGFVEPTSVFLSLGVELLFD